MMSESMREYTESIRQQGVAEGFAQGEAKGKAEMVRNMLGAGVPLETIIKVSGMSEEEIEALKA